MKDKIKNIAEKLEHQIRMHELDLNDRIKDIPQIILLLEQGFSELKEIVSFYKFKSEMDEIFFFKIIKPKFFSKLIYYRKVYNIEMMRPNGQDCVLKNYFINELNQLENFYNKNIDFYKYYRSGSTHLDKYFFLRGKQDIQMTMETFYFERVSWIRGLIFMSCNLKCGNSKLLKIKHLSKFSKRYFHLF